jgi:hypothetical protein
MLVIDSATILTILDDVTEYIFFSYLKYHKTPPASLLGINSTVLFLYMFLEHFVVQ